MAWPMCSWPVTLGGGITMVKGFLLLSILGAKAPEAAEALKITAADLKKLGVIDEIIPEPAGGAGKDPKAAAKAVKKAVLAALKELAKLPAESLPELRYAKFRAMGNFAKA